MLPCEQRIGPDGIPSESITDLDGGIMKRTCKAIGFLGVLLGMVLVAAPAASVTAQQTQDSSRISPTETGSTGYSDSLVRPGYRALLEDTTVGLTGDSTRAFNGIGSAGDTASRTGVGASADTTGMPARRSEDSTTPQ
jgi:hypothetical protein